MPLLRAMVIIPKDSGVPEDAAVNVWYFDATDSATAMPLITTALGSFYTAVASVFSKLVDETKVHVKFYDMDTLKPRPLLSDRPVTVIGPTGSLVLPPEVAVCLSFQATQVPGVAQARRRGRIYLGPCGFAASTTDENVPTAVESLVATAGNSLLSASNAAAAWSWVVVHAVDTVNQSAADVVGGWVDNAYDTQRRRGVVATHRTRYP